MSKVHRRRESGREGGCISDLGVVLGGFLVLKVVELEVIRSRFQDQHSCIHQVTFVMIQLRETEETAM